MPTLTKPRLVAETSTPKCDVNIGDRLFQIANKIVARRTRGRTLARGTSFRLSDFHAKLGQVVRTALRQTIGMSRAGLAAKLSFHLDARIGPNYVAKAEQFWAPTLDRLQVMASILELTPSAMVIAAEATQLCDRLNLDQSENVLHDVVRSFRGSLGSPNRRCTLEDRGTIQTWLCAADHANKNLLADALGAALKALRIGAGMSQSDVAARLGGDVTLALLNEFENGRAPCSWSRLATLSSVFNVSLGEMFTLAEREASRFAPSLVDQLDRLHELASQASATSDRALLAELAVQILGVRKQIGEFSRKRRASNRAH